MRYATRRLRFAVLQQAYANEEAATRWASFRGFDDLFHVCYIKNERTKKIVTKRTKEQKRTESPACTHDHED